MPRAALPPSYVALSLYLRTTAIGGRADRISLRVRTNQMRGHAPDERLNRTLLGDLLAEARYQRLTISPLRGFTFAEPDESATFVRTQQ
jgi:hypothetical protein